MSSLDFSLKNLVVQIETERFLLKTIDRQHVSERYLNWLSDTEVKSFIQYAKSNRSMEELSSYVESHFESEGSILFGIFGKKDLLHIGNIKYEISESDKSSAEMGILIGDPDWRGKAVGPEVIEESAAWLARSIGVEQVILGVNQTNVRAVAAYKKIGFHEDGEGPDANNSIYMKKSLQVGA